MKKVAVLIDIGFEESEFLLVVDIMRRAEVQCDILTPHTLLVRGAHNIHAKADFLVENVNFTVFDMLIIPSGVKKLYQNETVIYAVKEHIERNKWIGLINDAVTITDRIKIMEEMNDTFLMKDNFILCKGLAATYSFAYQCLELLGIESEPIKQRMVYYNAYDEKRIGK